MSTQTSNVRISLIVQEEWEKEFDSDIARRRIKSFARSKFICIAA
jgi:hypothetical protein